METIQEYYGCVTKTEQLWCLEEMGIPNTCILEARDAYPGYYGHIQGLSRPRLIFIMSNQKCTLEGVTRITTAVRRVFHHPFDAACCEIVMGGKEADGVRIHGIDDYSVIRDLQVAYASNGLELKKKEGKIENVEGLIKVRKFFRLASKSDQILMDMESRDWGYFRVDEDVDWERFKKIITRVRGNWTHHSFDAAKCFIYKGGEITDLVRIYSKELNQSFLERLRKAWMKAVSY